MTSSPVGYQMEIFDISSEDAGVPIAAPDGMTVMEQDLDVVPGLYVRLIDRDSHIQYTYHALSQLGLASRCEAAITQPAAVSCIVARQGTNADSYLAAIRGKSNERMNDARATFVASLGESALQDDVDVQVIQAWVGFREAFGGPERIRKEHGEPTRRAYMRELERAAGRYGIALPKIT